MKHNEVRKLWNANADTWTILSRSGYDTYRDHLNTPAFLDMLPDNHDLNGLDIGCGKGSNTRLLTEKGTRMTALDIADNFVCHAHLENSARGLGLALKLKTITYARKNGYARIRSENDTKDIPMLSLIKKLGFVRKTELITVEKQLQPSG